MTWSLAGGNSGADIRLATSDGDVRLDRDADGNGQPDVSIRPRSSSSWRRTTSISYLNLATELLNDMGMALAVVMETRREAKGVVARQAVLAGQLHVIALASANDEVVAGH